MRLVVRNTGLLLLVLCAGMLCYDLVRTVLSGELQITDVGSLWVAVHSTSLQELEAGISRYLWPFLWHPVMVTFLLLPAFAVVGVVGVLLMIAGRRRTRSGQLFSRP